MSEKESKKEAAPEAAPEEKPKKKKGGMKVIIMVIGAMVVEGVVLIVALKMGGPAETQASEQLHDLEPDGSQVPQELLVVEDKFQNLQTGRVWVWDSSIFVQVKTKDAATVEEILKRRSASIKEGISQIFSRAQHAQLTEPERQTLNRQILSFLSKLMEEEQKSLEHAGSPAGDGHGGDAHGAPSGGGHGKKDEEGGMIQKILIPKCRGFPTDF